MHDFQVTYSPYTGMLTCPFYLDLGQVLCPWPKMDLLSYPFQSFKKYLGQNQVFFWSFQKLILTKQILALVFFRKKLTKLEQAFLQY